MLNKKTNMKAMNFQKLQNSKIHQICNKWENVTLIHVLNRITKYLLTVAHTENKSHKKWSVQYTKYNYYWILFFIPFVYRNIATKLYHTTLTSFR